MVRKHGQCNLLMLPSVGAEQFHPPVVGGYQPSIRDSVAASYPALRGAIVHSDQGSQYTSRAYRAAVETKWQRLIRFMKRLIRASKQKVFLILDNLKVYHGKLAVSWLEHHKDKIEVFCLPSYAPEYNPGEYLNFSYGMKKSGGLQKPPLSRN